MNLDVVFQYQKLSDSRLIKGTAIVVDLLRASTTIICAIKSGAKQVIPFPDAGDAVAIANRLGGERVLGGERGGVKIPGFDLGNSPLEYTPAAVANKTVLLSTTNGTGAIQAAAAARRLYIGALINRSAVAQAAARASQDIVIVCAARRATSPPTTPWPQAPSLRLCSPWTRILPWGISPCAPATYMKITGKAAWTRTSSSITAAWHSWASPTTWTSASGKTSRRGTHLPRRHHHGLTPSKEWPKPLL